MIHFKMVGALCSDLLGALWPGIQGAFSTDQLGAHSLEFPVLAHFKELRMLALFLFPTFKLVTFILSRSAMKPPH